MVDHIIMQAAPVLLGTGIPLFTQKEELKRYRLESVKKYGQFAELVYEKGIRCVWKMFYTEEAIKSNWSTRQLERL